MANQSNFDEEDLQIGSRRIINQLNTFVPQIHLTLVSVLQGVALGFLMFAFKAPSISSWNSFIHDIYHNLFYLPFLTSLVLIVIAWTEFTFASFILHWPITTLSSLIQFIFTIFEIAAFNSLNNFGLWIIWFGFCVFIGGLIRLRNIHIGDDSMDISKTTHGVIYGRSDGLNYLIFVILIPLGIWRLFPWFPSNFKPWFDLSLPAILFIMGILFMAHDDKRYVKVINQLLEDGKSSYRLYDKLTSIKHGKIMKTRTDEHPE